MWIRPDRNHILHHLLKFETDFLETVMFCMTETASETKQNDRYIIVIAKATQEL